MDGATQTDEIGARDAEGHLPADHAPDGDGRGPHRRPGRLARRGPGTMTATVKRLADRRLVDHTPVPGRGADRVGPPGGRRRHPPAPHRRALPGRHARLRLERGRPAGPDLRARVAPGGRGPAVRRPRPARDLPARLPHPRRRRSRSSPRCRRCTTSSRATWPSWPCPGRPIPRSWPSSTPSGCARAWRSRSARSTRSTGRSSCASAGRTAPSGEKVARQIYVRESTWERPHEASPEREEKGAVGMMIVCHVLAAEGGYQAFHLRGVEWFWLVLCRRAPALLAIGVGVLPDEGRAGRRRRARPR